MERSRRRKNTLKPQEERQRISRFTKVAAFLLAGAVVVNFSGIGGGSQGKTSNAASPAKSTARADIPQSAGWTNMDSKSPSQSVHRDAKAAKGVIKIKPSTPLDEVVIVEETPEQAYASKLKRMSPEVLAGALERHSLMSMSDEDLAREEAKLSGSQETSPASEYGPTGAVRIRPSVPLDSIVIVEETPEQAYASKLRRMSDEVLSNALQEHGQMGAGDAGDDINATIISQINANKRS